MGKRMKIKQFLVLIRRAARGTLDAAPYTKAGFVVNKQGQIDSAEECCPVHELAWRLHDNHFPGCVFESGKILGLTRRSTTALMNAADNKVRGPLRRQLLRACGLKEKKPE